MTHKSVSNTQDLPILKLLRGLTPDAITCIGRVPIESGLGDQDFRISHQEVSEIAAPGEAVVLVADIAAGLCWRSQLGWLRSQLCPLIFWLAPLNSDAKLANELRALGFFEIGQAANRIVFCYELDGQNPKREWNNASHWAHPQNYR